MLRISFLDATTSAGNCDSTASTCSAKPRPQFSWTSVTRNSKHDQHWPEHREWHVWKLQFAMLHGMLSRMDGWKVKLMFMDFSHPHQLINR